MAIDGHLERVAQYADPDSEQHRAAVEWIRGQLGLTSLSFQRIDDMVKAIGIEKSRLCTHCWDASSYF
jgi:amidophosphoribosyltransferase